MLKLAGSLSVIVVLACMVNCGTFSNIQEQQEILEPKLKDVYKGAFYIGTGLDSSQIYGGDPKALTILKEQFNAITAENIMKWEKLQPELGRYYFTVADSFVSLGEIIRCTLLDTCFCGTIKRPSGFLRIHPEIWWTGKHFLREFVIIFIL